MERRLTTILAADVVEYSRLMGDDEAATLTALKTLRRELVKPKEIQYRGRTVKLMGDGALMEFASVVDAVTFAVEVQAAMAEHEEAGTTDSEEYKSAVKEFNKRHVMRRSRGEAPRRNAPPTLG